MLIIYKSCKRCRYLKKALLATYVSWSQEIQYLGKDEYKHLLLYQLWRRNPWLQVQRHKKPCDKLDYLRKWVCVSKFHTNDYRSSRRSSHTKHSDTRKEFACDAFNKSTIELGFVRKAEHTTGWWLTKSSTIPYLLSH
jgi:hypothetical protein